MKLFTKNKVDGIMKEVQVFGLKKDLQLNFER